MQHLGIVVASVLLGLVLAFPLALLARRYRRLEGVVLGITHGDLHDPVAGAVLAARARDRARPDDGRHRPRRSTR